MMKKYLFALILVLAIVGTATASDPWEGYVPDSISGAAPLTVNFTDISYNSPTAWNWSFRDVTGNNTEIWFSQEQNSSILFPWAGNYSIRLNSSNAYGYNITPELVFVNVSGTHATVPDANFTCSPLTGSDPLSVYCTDLSTNTPTNWDWYSWHGEGTELKESDLKNWSTIFVAGIFDIRLYVSNAFGGTWMNKSSYVVVSSGTYYPVQAQFSANVTSGASPLQVGFTSTSLNASTHAWYWYANETVSSTAQNPTTAFTTGTYNVRLKATNATGGSDWENKTSYIVVGNMPTAAFSGSVTSGTVPLTVAFTDSSTNSPTSWAWDFDNNGANDSYIQNPSHTYTSIGVYTVKLSASNAWGGDSEIKTDYITVYPAAPIAEFTADDVYGVAPHTVHFTDLSTNSPGTWSWDFGDTGTSVLQNPTHIYNSAGVYTVSLTATGSGGSDTETKSGYITVVLVPTPTLTYPTWTTTVTPVVSALPQTGYRFLYYDPLVASMWDLSNMTPIGVSVYGDVFGVNGNLIVMGSWIVTLLVLYWLRHEDVMVPMFMLVILGNIMLFTITPREWQWFLVVLLLMIPVGATMYSLFKGPKQ